MRPLLAALAIAWLAACAAGAPAPGAPTQGAPAPTASGPAGPQAAQGAPAGSVEGWKTVDPRSIRCGVDDQPRNVIDKQGSAHQAAGERGAKRVIDPFYSPAPPPRLVVNRLAPTTGEGKPLPAEAAEQIRASDPDYESCEALATAPPGPVTFELELAPTGKPVRVAPLASDTIDAYRECLMERACQLQTSAALPATRLRVPLSVSLYVPAGTQLPEGSVKVEAEGSDPADPLASNLLRVVDTAVRMCGSVEGKVRVKLRAELRLSTVSAKRRSMTRLVIQKLDALPVQGAVPPEVMACVTAAIKQRNFPAQTPNQGRTESFTITWNP